MRCVCSGRLWGRGPLFCLTGQGQQRDSDGRPTPTQIEGKPSRVSVISRSAATEERAASVTWRRPDLVCCPLCAPCVVVVVSAERTLKSCCRGEHTDELCCCRGEHTEDLCCCRGEHGQLGCDRGGHGQLTSCDHS